jgi:hypothetical protein
LTAAASANPVAVSAATTHLAPHRAIRTLVPETRLRQAAASEPLALLLLAAALGILGSQLRRRQPARVVASPSSGQPRVASGREPLTTA